MRSAEMLPEIGTPAGRQGVDGDAGGIGGDQRSRGAVLLHLVEKLSLDIRVFHHGFYNPVTVGNIFQVIGKVTRRDTFYHLFGEDGSGGGFQCSLQGLASDTVPDGGILRVEAFADFPLCERIRHDIKQQYGQSGSGKVAGDPGSHHPGTKHGHSSDEALHIVSFKL